MMTDLDEAMLAGWQEAQAEEKESKPKKEVSYNFYDKRVTLNLARLSATVAEKPELKSALAKLPELNWDIYKLPQADIEHIYAEFDADLEARVKAEFEADPAFLVDLKHSEGTCPLCGHQGIRWLFRIQNLKGGESIECGSECIIIHGLHVKGTETAEHARKALETAIRRAMRKLLIEQWHIDFDFKPELLESLGTALAAIRKEAFSQKDPVVRRAMSTAWYKQKDLAKLQKFYDRNGWLGTELRWGEWSRLAKFARQFNEACRTSVPFPREWPKKAPAVEAQVTLSATGEVKEAKVVDLMAKEADEGLMPGPAGYVPTPAPEVAPAPAQTLEELDAKATEVALAKLEAKPKTVTEPAKVEEKKDAKEPDFGSLAHDLVFG